MIWNTVLVSCYLPLITVELFGLNYIELLNCLFHCCDSDTGIDYDYNINTLSKTISDFLTCTYTSYLYLGFIYECQI